MLMTTHPNKVEYFHWAPQRTHKDNLWATWVQGQPWKNIWTLLRHYPELIWEKGLSLEESHHPEFWVTSWAAAISTEGCATERQRWRQEEWSCCSEQASWWIKKHRPHYGSYTSDSQTKDNLLKQDDIDDQPIDQQRFYKQIFIWIMTASHGLQILISPKILDLTWNKTTYSRPQTWFKPTWAGWDVIEWAAELNGHKQRENTDTCSISMWHKLVNKQVNKPPARVKREEIHISMSVMKVTHMNTAQI